MLIIRTAGSDSVYGSRQMGHSWSAVEELAVEESAAEVPKGREECVIGVVCIFKNL